MGSRETGNGKRETVGPRSRPYHEKLDAYELGRRLVLDLYRDTAEFPAEERYGLTPQIRRAAISIPANIAEGAARKSKKEFSQPGVDRIEAVALMSRVVSRLPAKKLLSPIVSRFPFPVSRLPPPVYRSCVS